MIIGKAAQRDECQRYADDRDAFAAQEERCPSWRRAKRGGVVACGVQGPLVDGGGELPEAGSAGDGHACSLCAPVRAIHNDPVVKSEGGPLAQPARRRCDTCVETLVQKARTPITSGIHGLVFLELCYASDPEVAAHSVVIRVTSFEDVQLSSRRSALYCLLMICKAYEAHEVVASILVWIPCIAGTAFRRNHCSCFNSLISGVKVSQSEFLIYASLRHRFQFFYRASISSDESPCRTIPIRFSVAQTRVFSIRKD